MRGALWLICAILVVGPAIAQDVPTRPKARPATALPAVEMPKPSLKPLPRPNLEAVVPMVLALDVKAAPPASQLRPKPRPIRETVVQTTPTTAALLRSPRPAPRPKALRDAVAAAKLPPQTGTTPAADPAKPNIIQLLFGAKGAEKQPKEEDIASAAPAQRAPSFPASNAPRKGSVCGDRAIRGEVIKPITSKVQGCGVPEAVRVTEVSGIRLTQAVTVECGTVQALKTWIDTKMRPAFGARDVVQLRIAAHYACRGRNNKKGARISEHGKGRALDISGFIFADGKEWTIARDYNKQVRAAHKGACGIFGTTLGPGSDGYHEDHLHFDTASYRSGPYCR